MSYFDEVNKLVMCDTYCNWWEDELTFEAADFLKKFTKEDWGALRNIMHTLPNEQKYRIAQLMHFNICLDSFLILVELITVNLHNDEISSTCIESFEYFGKEFPWHLLPKNAIDYIITYYEEIIKKSQKEWYIKKLKEFKEKTNYIE